MALTGKVSVIADYWYAELLAAKDALGLEAVYYGDQAKIPYNPTLCVEPSTKANNRVQGAAARKFNPEIDIGLIIYHSAITSTQENARESVVLAEQIEDFVLARPNAEGLVISCYVTTVEPGYIERGSTLMRATKLNVMHKTQFTT